MFVDTVSQNAVIYIPNRFPYLPYQSTVMQCWQNRVNNNCLHHISLLCQFNEYGGNSHAIFQDRRDDEPQITEEVFFSKMLPILMIYVEVLVPELKKHGILLDESIVSSLLPPMDTIDELHYVMYRLGKKENGLQIFYRCLRETQNEYPDHRRAADRIESEGIL